MLEHDGVRTSHVGRGEGEDRLPPAEVVGSSGLWLYAHGEDERTATPCHQIIPNFSLDCDFESGLKVEPNGVGHISVTFL